MLGVKRLGELSRLTVAHRECDVPDGHSDGQHLRGALHAYPLEVCAKARLTCLREDALQLAWRARQSIRHLLECEGLAVFQRDDADGFLIELPAPHLGCPPLSSSAPHVGPPPLAILTRRIPLTEGPRQPGPKVPAAMACSIVPTAGGPRFLPCATPPTS